MDMEKYNIKTDKFTKDRSTSIPFVQMEKDAWLIQSAHIKLSMRDSFSKGSFTIMANASSKTGRFISANLIMVKNREKANSFLLQENFTKVNGCKASRMGKGPYIAKIEKFLLKECGNKDKS